MGSLRVDVWKMAHELIEQVFRRADRCLGQPDRLHRSFGNVDDETNLKLLHRIAFGITLDGPAVRPSASRDYAAVASELVVREYLERMREHALLASLAVRHGHPLASAVNARDVVEASLQATIAARGLPFSGDKWLCERLAADASDLAPHYERFAVLPDPVQDSGPFVERAVREAAELTGVDLSLDALAADCEWRNTDLRLVQVGGCTIFLSLRDGALWELTSAEADTWRDLVAQSKDGEPAAAWSCAGRSHPETALCLALHERGLVDLVWLRGLPTGDAQLAAAL